MKYEDCPIIDREKWLYEHPDSLVYEVMRSSEDRMFFVNYLLKTLKQELQGASIPRQCLVVDPYPHEPTIYDKSEDVVSKFIADSKGNITKKTESDKLFVSQIPIAAYRYTSVGDKTTIREYMDKVLKDIIDEENRLFYSLLEYPKIASSYFNGLENEDKVGTLLLSKDFQENRQLSIFTNKDIKIVKGTNDKSYFMPKPEMFGAMPIIITLDAMDCTDGRYRTVGLVVYEYVGMCILDEKSYEEMYI